MITGINKKRNFNKWIKWHNWPPAHWLLLLSYLQSYHKTIWAKASSSQRTNKRKKILVKQRIIFKLFSNSLPIFIFIFSNSDRYTIWWLYPMDTFGTDSLECGNFLIKFFSEKKKSFWYFLLRIFLLFIYFFWNVSQNNFPESLVS